MAFYFCQVHYFKTALILRFNFFVLFPEQAASPLILFTAELLGRYKSGAAQPLSGARPLVPALEYLLGILLCG